jgi:hypothetical protein
MSSYFDVAVANIGKRERRMRKPRGNGGWFGVRKVRGAQDEAEVESEIGHFEDLLTTSSSSKM